MVVQPAVPGHPAASHYSRQRLRPFRYGWAAMLALVLSSCSSTGRLGGPSQSLLLSAPLAAAHTGIVVADANTGRQLFNYQGDKYFIPASNTKIVSCYAAMKYLGDSLPGLRYHAADDGTVEIAGTGDPVFLHPEFSSQRVLAFLKTFKKIRWSEPIFDEALGSGWQWDDYHDSYMVQRSPLPMYGNVARFTLGAKKSVSVLPAQFASQVKPGSIAGAQGFNVVRDWDKNEFTILDGNHPTQEVPFNANMGTMRELLEQATGVPVESDPFGSLPLAGSGIIYSIPTDSMLKPMMYRSDNFYAEQTLMMVSQKLLHRFDIGAITDTLLKSDLAGLPQIPRWADGSGLSRYNLFSPADFIKVMQKMLELPRGLERVRAIFPTGGQGSLKNYYIADSSFIYAKTGTMSGVVSLSGLLYAKSGRAVLFSIIVNNNRAPASDVRVEVEKFVESVREKF
ncbi:MAG: hypothetical protein EOO05_06390 [Chitinophagaceae bacterium]|nr:MAG: hypothetical protein EOO05_06390 [Chitinophagaceae bacterium]